MSQIVAVHGVQSTIAYLRRFEKDLYKNIRKELINSARPTVSAVAAEFPKEPWDSSRGVKWTKYGRTERGRKPAGASGASFPRYQHTKVRRGVKADTGSSRRRSDGTYAILRIKQTDAAGAIYDLAKNQQTTVPDRGSFVKNLNNAKRGKPNSRVMWPTVEKHLPELIQATEKILRDIEQMYSAQIAADSAQRQAASARATKQVRNAAGQFKANVKITTRAARVATY
jgi:hypothetical protein